MYQAASTFFDTIQHITDHIRSRYTDCPDLASRVGDGIDALNARMALLWPARAASLMPRAPTSIEYPTLALVFSVRVRVRTKTERERDRGRDGRTLNERISINLRV